MFSIATMLRITVQKPVMNSHLLRGAMNTKIKLSQVTKTKNVPQQPVSPLYLSLSANLKGNEQKIKNQSLRKKIKTSYVIENSGFAAVENFLNTPRFNHIRDAIASVQRTETELEKMHIMKGNIKPLSGKGVMTSLMPERRLPAAVDYVLNDKSNDVLIKNTQTTDTILKSYKGATIVASAILPGSPFGNYFNQQRFSNDLTVIELENGRCGTAGFCLDLSLLSDNKPLLIHGGELSGCTVVYAMQGERFYAYHCGKSNLDESGWKTGTDGALSIMQSHAKLSGTSAAAISNNANNQLLSDYLAHQFDFATLAYCGHGEKVLNAENTYVFDYNRPATLSQDTARVGSSLALIVKENGTYQIQTLCDDMAINTSTFETSTLSHLIHERSLTPF